ncbi:SGNH/GDSL hydrolase family protein [Paenibacillus yanchengensis]|uniref:SGNH/GDSL hydrolase family protein n=1 Tax=Paenibacillus yanchengensis TaxID=2035833 RepID=A0ABW4YIS5_9BACL
MLLSKGQRLLFIGDSITDCGRARPMAEGNDALLGTGYVSLIQAFLRSTYPELEIHTINQGIGGNTVRDLKNRWQEDVIAHRPDWLAISIGINDVWRQFDSPTMPEKHVYEEEYEQTLRQLIVDTKSKVQGTIVLSPFYLEVNKEDPMRAKMDTYSAIAHRVATEQKVLFVDVQAAFDQVLQHLYSTILAADRVHPHTTGHIIIARAFLQAIGYDWNKGISL